MGMEAFKEKTEKRNIAIWGVGVLQTDIEAIYNIHDVFAYIDDEINDNTLISVKKEEIHDSGYIEDIKDDNVLFILCTGDIECAVRILTQCGYDENDYILGEELLIGIEEIYASYKKSDISIYGTGDTYMQNRILLNDNGIQVDRFVVTKKNDELYCGLPVLSVEKLSALKDHTRIIVASIYYKEIYRILVDKGFEPGKDFMQIDTFSYICKYNKGLQCNYNFVNRQKGLSKALIILSGYKQLIWKSVFGRVEKYVENDMDVCIVTSGKEDDEMKKLCEKNAWSYLSTDKNNVSLVTNLAVWLHPNADYIYKMDEDIFVTSGIFNSLYDTYLRVEEDSEYEVGFVTPLIPVNGYGFARLLNILNIKDLWESKFGEMKITDCYNHHKAIHDMPEAARFMWGEGNPKMTSIDKIQNNLQNMDYSYSICPVRYSIGLILFHRNNWLKMGMFPVIDYFNMGADEVHICEFCMMSGKAMVVSENNIVGHMSYGPQHKAMEEYYKEIRRGGRL